ncbi:DUF2752 domain-containing protein [Cohnella cholangitidis]|uniref:DUF2752 domain-containing protein n=1 Tax=Cohnella cholangitidis TaxID=2598458 RepID=A0A7G5BYI8_9BACL|nr:DUF2752 domain-containing protein [Cohnella cholangitidis]QMV42022.1 DUF2752 domain-containing protein [Cohnella cholangitidis]
MSAFTLKNRPAILWGSLLGVGGALYLTVWLPATGIGIPCVFHELTGLYCPGCGITRAALSLLRLDFTQAYRYNALVFGLAPIYLMYVMTRKKRMPRTSNVLMAAMLVLTVGFGLARNLPMFDWLAPTLIR